MKKLSAVIALLLCVFVLGDTSVCFAYETNTNAPSAVCEYESEYVDGEVIAVLDNTCPREYLAENKADEAYGEGVSLLDSYNIEGSDSETDIKAVSLKSDDKTTGELISALEDNPAVEYVFPNYKMHPDSLTNDDYSDCQWSLSNTGQNGGTVDNDINADALWGKAAQSDEEQVVAIIDTGIDETHEDLKEVLWHNTNPDISGDYGYDFANHDTEPNDVSGHGTHIAGIIAAAADNSKGISGINKDNVKVMALKVDDGNNTFYTSAIFDAFDYITKAKKLGVNITAVNCSFSHITDNVSSKQAYERVFDTLGELGIITCVCSGNYSSNLNTYYETEGKYVIPACCDSEYCITVAACDENDNLLSFSNYGDEYVDVAAPGVHILSTVPDYTFNPSIYTPSQREALCAYYQDYTDISDHNAFGINVSKYAFDDYSLNIGRNRSQFFGAADGSLEAVNPDGAYGKDFSFYIEMPFELENADDSYYISFMSKFLGDAYAAVADVPADYDVQSNFKDLALNGVKFGKYANSVRWFDKVIKTDTNAEGYIKSTSRKLVFCYLNVKGPVLLDCIGISRQGVDETGFGKYDFKEGTSMATPFVTGAVALLRSAYDEYSAKDIINIIKTKGRVSPALTDYVKNGIVLSLNDTESYISEVEIPAVSGLSATDITEDSITVKWDSVGFKHAEYYPEYKTYSGDWIQLESTSERSLTLSGLSADTAYSFRVRAKAIDKFGDYSSVVTATTDKPVPAVSGLTAVDITENSISISWNSVDIPDAQYCVEYKTQTGDWQEHCVTSSLSTTVTGLSPVTPYCFRIRALAGERFGDYSSEMSAVTNQRTIPTVEGLSVSDSTEYSLTLRWNAVSEPNTHYIVEYREKDSDWQVFDEVKFLSLSVTGLSPSTTYLFRVRAISDGIYGGYSDELSAATDDEVIILSTPKISKPQRSDLLYSNKSGIKLRVMKLDEEADGVQLCVYNGNGSVKFDKYLPANTVKSKGCVVTGLKRNQFYYARLRAYKLSFKGERVFGSWSDTVNFAVGIKPTVKAQKSGIKVSWSKVAGATGYTVYYSQNGKTYKKHKTTKSVSLVIAKKYLRKNKKYYIKVVAAKKSSQSLDNVVKTVKAK